MHDELVYGERASTFLEARGYLMKGEKFRNAWSRPFAACFRVEVFLSDRLMGQIASRLGHAKKTTRPPIERLSDRELEVFPNAWTRNEHYGHRGEAQSFG